MSALDEAVRPAPPGDPLARLSRPGPIPPRVQDRRPNVLKERMK